MSSERYPALGFILLLVFVCSLITALGLTVAALGDRDMLVAAVNCWILVVVCMIANKLYSA